MKGFKMKKIFILISIFILPLLNVKAFYYSSKDELEILNYKKGNETSFDLKCEYNGEFNRFDAFEVDLYSEEKVNCFVSFNLNYVNEDYYLNKAKFDLIIPNELTPTNISYTKGYDINKTGNTYTVTRTSSLNQEDKLILFDLVMPKSTIDNLYKIVIDNIYLENNKGEEIGSEGQKIYRINFKTKELVKNDFHFNVSCSVNQNGDIRFSTNGLTVYPEEILSCVVGYDTAVICYGDCEHPTQYLKNVNFDLIVPEELKKANIVYTRGFDVVNLENKFSITNNNPSIMSDIFMKFELTMPQVSIDTTYNLSIDNIVVKNIKDEVIGDYKQSSYSLFLVVPKKEIIQKEEEKSSMLPAENKKSPKTNYLLYVLIGGIVLAAIVYFIVKKINLKNKNLLEKESI